MRCWIIQFCLHLIGVNVGSNDQRGQNVKRFSIRRLEFLQPLPHFRLRRGAQLLEKVRQHVKMLVEDCGGICNKLIEL